MGKATLVTLLFISPLLLLVFANVDSDSYAKSYEYTVHTIGGLFRLSVAPELGENRAAAASLAVTDVNDWLATEGKDWRLELEIGDTAADGDLALGLMQDMHADGIDFFVGPLGSGVVAACLDYANANQILYISPSATSPFLSADDWFYRFCVSEAAQARVIAALIDEAGTEEFIFSWHGNEFGDWMQMEVAAALSDLNPAINIHAPEELRFVPGQSDFTAEVSNLDALVTDLVDQGAAYKDIGFVLLSRGEVADFLSEADGYEQLRSILWFGSEYNIFNEELITNPVAAQFAADVGFIGSNQRINVDLPELTNYDNVRNHIQAELGREADLYSYSTYDIIWALALSIDEAGYDSVAVRDILPDIINEWSQVYGASGHIVLNEYGDRSFIDYALWIVFDHYELIEVGYYEGITGNVFWYDLPTFRDVPPDHPFFMEIEKLVALGITTGWPDDTFRPTLSVTRQAMAAFLYRAFDLEDPGVTEPSFTDVPEDHTFFAEIEALAATGITTGWPDGTFRPTLPVTRQAAAAFLFRALELEDPGVTEPTFSDVPEDHPFFTEVEALAATGITTGWPDGTFRPNLAVTRQAMAAFLIRALELEQ